MGIDDVISSSEDDISEDFESPPPAKRQKAPPAKSINTPDNNVSSSGMGKTHLAATEEAQQIVLENTPVSQPINNSDTSWWTSEKPRLEWSESAQTKMKATSKLWFNQLAPEELSKLEIRAEGKGENRRFSVYPGPPERNQQVPGITLGSVMGLVRKARVDGLGELKLNKRKYKFTLVPYFTPVNTEQYTASGGEIEQFASNLSNQMPASREIFSNQWIPRFRALIVRIAEALWDFHDGDGTVIFERQSVEKRLNNHEYDEKTKRTKFQESRDVFIEDFVQGAEYQWSEETGDLYLKRDIYTESKYGDRAREDSDKFVFEQCLQKQSCELSPAEQTKMYTEQCSGGNPAYHLQPLQFEDKRGRKIPYGAGAEDTKINLCATPLRVNDCILVNVFVTVSTVNNKSSIVFKIGGTTVKIWERGPATSAASLVAF